MDTFDIPDPKPVWQVAVEDFESFLNSSLSGQLAELPVFDESEGPPRRKVNLPQVSLSELPSRKRLPDPYPFPSAAPISERIVSDVDTLSDTLDRLNIDLEKLKSELSGFNKEDDLAGSSSPQAPISAELRLYIKSKIRRALRDHETVCERVIKHQLQLDLARAAESILDVVDAKLQTVHDSGWAAKWSGCPQSRMKCEADRLPSQYHAS
ncbi:hypothetical protein HDV00_004177 [Rhizophlyctis rosea]|nr:hypothetical protein HDV00_004177 [Rhizophlyctis rosea]